MGSIFDSLVALCDILYCRYANRDRLSPEHERTIVEMLLPYHPEFEKKIGCGIDYIMVCNRAFAIWNHHECFAKWNY